MYVCVCVCVYVCVCVGVCTHVYIINTDYKRLKMLLRHLGSSEHTAAQILQNEELLLESLQVATHHIHFTHIHV